MDGLYCKDSVNQNLEVIRFFLALVHMVFANSFRVIWHVKYLFTHLISHLLNTFYV